MKLVIDFFILLFVQIRTYILSIVLLCFGLHKKTVVYSAAMLQIHLCLQSLIRRMHIRENVRGSGMVHIIVHVQIISLLYLIR